MVYLLIQAYTFQLHCYLKSHLFLKPPAQLYLEMSSSFPHICLNSSLRIKCPYSGLFWPVFSRIRTECGEIRSISPYSVRMWVNTDQNNSEHEHFSCSVTWMMKDSFSSRINIQKCKALSSRHTKPFQRRYDIVRRSKIFGSFYQLFSKYLCTKCLVNSKFSPNC